MWLQLRSDYVRSVAALLAVSVEPKGLDQLGHGRWYEPVDRLAAADAVTDLARRDRHRLDLEQLDALRPRIIKCAVTVIGDGIPKLQDLVLSTSARYVVITSAPGCTADEICSL